MDLFGNSYLSDPQRAIAAETSRAFDNSRSIQERNMSRYGLPALANFEKDWALGRASSTADQTNRMRMRPSQDRGHGSTMGGLMQLLPFLLGQDETNNLFKGGLINYFRGSKGSSAGLGDESGFGILDSASNTNVLDARDAMAGFGGLGADAYSAGTGALDWIVG